MEDNSQGFRRSRPPPRSESSASSSRMTPLNSSTNSSTVNLPGRPNTGRGASGASLLQERLRERKVESARQNRRRSVDLSGERGVQSSPIKSSGKEERRPSSSGAGKAMGVKQIEEHVSTLTKQNFNLKLELHHRRERQSALEARLEAAEKQIEEQRELQEVNEQLLAELEKRDQAVEEAVGIIVNLEDKIERLMQEREAVQSFDDKYEPSFFRPSLNNLSSSPPEPAEKRPYDRKAMARMPSFLSEQSEGADALRSLYLPGNHSYKDSDATLPKLLEEAPDRMNSPRISMLSESSLLSVYGDKQLALDLAQQDEEQDLPLRRHRKSSSVEKWVDERPVSPALAPPRADIRKNQYLSINDVMESPLQRLEKLKLTLEKNNKSAISTRLQLERGTSVKEARKPRENLRRVFTDKKSFDHQQGLPPTPDTISTSTLRHFQANSNDTLAQDAHEKTFLSSTSTIPAPSETHNAYQSALSLRPRSAGETITSRREGHGWDTETQGDDFSSTASTFSAAQDYDKPARIMTPNLFTFGDFDADDGSQGWTGNMMFSGNDSRGLPSQTASRYAALRSNSMAEHPRSDDTVTNRAVSRYNDSVYGTSPIDTSPRPDPPDRRSSLSAATKLRKAREINNSSNSSGQATSASSPAAKQDYKRSRLTSRLFGRSDTAAVIDNVQQSLQRPKGNSSRAQSYFEGSYENDEVARATPPPIKRSRDSNLPRYRPSSAGTGLPPAQNTLRRGSAFGFGGDGAGDEIDTKRRSIDIAEVEDSNQTKSAGRKWLGFGRTGSLRQK